MLKDNAGGIRLHATSLDSLISVPFLFICWMNADNI